MQLKKIYFDAFKSFLRDELEINDNCIGLVGINETGKSNLLYAINALRGGRKLTINDTPKMEGKIHNPTLRFEFEPTSDERKTIIAKIQDWSEKNTLIGKDINKSNFKVIYHIIFNKEKNIEECFFHFEGLELDRNYLILSKDFFGDLYKIKYKDDFVKLDQAIIIRNSDLKINENYLKIIDDLEAINFEIVELETDIENTEENIEVNAKADGSNEVKTKESSKDNLDEGSVPIKDKGKLIEKTKEKIEKIVQLNIKKNELETKIKNFT